MGICVPIRDAAWETSNLYEDLYQRPHCCANVCKKVVEAAVNVADSLDENKAPVDPDSYVDESADILNGIIDKIEKAEGNVVDNEEKKIDITDSSSSPSPARFVNDLDTQFELMNCDVCGSKSIHLCCGGLSSPLDDWACSDCTRIMTGDRMECPVR